MSFELKHLGHDRYLVWDLLRETNPYYLNHHLFDVDFSSLENDRKCRKEFGEPVPTYIAYSLAAYAMGLAKFPEVNSYLRIWPFIRLAVYSGVDIALTVERDWMNRRIILLAILREAQTLSVAAVNQFLQHRKTAPLEDLEEFANYRRLLRIPAFCRWYLFQIFAKPFPGLMRKIVGTTAFTSIGKYGTLITSPISPRSSTMSIGKVEVRPRVKEGTIVPCLSAWVTFSYDHRVVDGAYIAQMGSFIKNRLENWND